MCQLAASCYVIQMIIQVGRKRCQHKSTSCSSIFPWTNLGFPTQLWGPEDIRRYLGSLQEFFFESDMFGWKIYLSHPFSTWFTIERTSVALFTQAQITTEIHGVFVDVSGTSTRFKIFWDRKHRPENKFPALQHSKQICLVLLGGWAKPLKRRQLRESSNRPRSDGF